MCFICLPMDKLYKTKKKKKKKNGREKKRLKTLSGWLLGRFYMNLADNVDTFLGSDFYGKFASDADLPSEDVQKYLPTSSDFSKGIENDITTT